MNKLNKFLSYFFGFWGIIVFIASVYYASVPSKSDMPEATEVTTNSGLGWLFLSYLLVLAAIAIYTESVSIKDFYFNNISLYSFYLFSLLLPIAFISAILSILNGLGIALNFIAQVIFWLIQAFFIAIWFFPKLYQLNRQEASKERDVSMMKLDYYSTFAILLLTIVWVVYDIMSIKIGFATVMGEFLLVQMLIKKKQINELEKQLIRVKR